MELFVESLENVPPELERNFTLMTELDKRSGDVITKINDCVDRYRLTKKGGERIAIRKEADALFVKLKGFADDKLELATQTYELIDKNIRRLISLQPQVTDQDGTIGTPMIGFDMPLDPNEPVYCTCRGVSHGEMVACENKECPIEWFHYACVGIIKKPPKVWYCPHCLANLKKTPKSRRKSSRRY